MVETVGIDQANRVIAAGDVVYLPDGDEFVPPVMDTRNCWVVTTFTEMVAGRS